MRLNILSLTLAASALLYTNAECDGIDPFAGQCLEPGETCTEDRDSCCEGGCFGFNFYKKCQDPPECFETFHDCGVSGDIECCGNLECTKTSADLYECRPPMPNTRTTELPDGSEVVEPVPEDEEPEEIPDLNLETTKDGNPVTYNVACVTGDPHMDTFDGMNWNCQGHGEHVIFRSSKTRREVQGRFVPINGGKVSITRALVIQDEGDTPKVQVQVPVHPDMGFHNTLGSSECPIQVLVNDVVINPWQGSGHDGVEIKVRNSFIEIRYPESEMFVTIAMGGSKRCVLNSCYYIPTSDTTLFGILGSPDGIMENDWATRDGQSSVTLPDKKGRKGQEAYDYCTTHWCITNERDSMFMYNERGVGFKDFMQCDHEFGSVPLEEIMAKATQEMIRACTENDILDDDCLTDAVLEGLDMALDGAGVRHRTKKTCNKKAGKCTEDSDCCKGLTCADEGFLGGSCIPVGATEPECLGYLQKCNDKHPCCPDHECIVNKNNKGFCHPILECQRKNTLCASDDECCGRMSCVGKQGEERCRDVGSGDSKCLSKGESCGFGINCCAGSTCIDDPDVGHMCVELPQCWAEADKPCNDRKDMPDCCEGFSCEWSFGRKLCKKLPECAVEFAKCDQVDCCTDGKELMCKAFTNKKGITTSRCVDAEKEKRAQERREWQQAQKEHLEKLAAEAAKAGN